MSLCVPGGGAGEPGDGGYPAQRRYGGARRACRPPRRGRPLARRQASVRRGHRVGDAADTRGVAPPPAAHECQRRVGGQSR